MTNAAGGRAQRPVDKAREIVQAAEVQRGLNYEALAQTVWDFVPTPTAEGQKQIDEAEKEPSTRSRRRRQTRGSKSRSRASTRCSRSFWRTS